MLSNSKLTLNTSLTLCDMWDDCFLRNKTSSISSKISFYILELLYFIYGYLSFLFKNFDESLFFLTKKKFILFAYIYKTWEYNHMINMPSFYRGT